MMCQRIGLPPISTIGFGLTFVSSLRREPNPPARMTSFIRILSWARRNDRMAKLRPLSHITLNHSGQTDVHLGVRSASRPRFPGTSGVRPPGHSKRPSG